MNQSKAEKLFELLEKFFGGSEKEQASPEITKALDEENRTALFVVLEPQEGFFTTDLHADTYDEDEVRKACHNFNSHCMKANLFHRVETESAEIVESYINPANFTLEDGRTIKSGTWLQVWYFPKTNEGEELWKMTKSGQINGVSIGCKVWVEEFYEEA